MLCLFLSVKDFSSVIRKNGNNRKYSLSDGFDLEEIRDYDYWSYFVHSYPFFFYLLEEYVTEIIVATQYVAALINLNILSFFVH